MRTRSVVQNLYRMPQTVRLNLKIRSLTVQPPNEPKKKIDNSTLRFQKLMEMSAIPKAGEVLQLTAGPEQVPFECTVVRADWDEHDNMFVVSCSYLKSPMREADYWAIAEGSDWTAKALL